MYLYKLKKNPIKQNINAMKIVRVNRYEFETLDGQVFDHPIPFNEDPLLEEFQKIHNTCHQSLSGLLTGEDNERDGINK